MSALEKIDHALNKLFFILLQKGKEEEYQYVMLAILTILGFPIFYLIWHNFYPQHYESFLLRIIAGFLAIPLLLKNYWPKKIRFILPIYWYITLIYIIPFFFTFMILKNNGSMTWQLNGLMALILLLLLTDWIMVLILGVIGVIFAIVLYLLTTASPHLPAHLVSIIGSYTPTLIFFALFLRNRAMVEKEKLETLRSTSAIMAHELRTPLRSISFSLSSIKQQLPGLISKNETEELSDTIKFSVDDAESELNSAFTVIDMLLIKSNISTINPEKYQTCSIVHSINEALRRYPFDIGQEKLISWQEYDFKFLGDELLMVHILFNLLKNSLYYIKAVGKGSIRIWCEETPKMNILHFYDSGKGIAPKVLSHIFDAFYTKTYHGTGVGLSFCKYVMRSFGGDITCNSKENEFTDFILSFPKMAEK